VKESVVFFGSGPVAAESLRLLAENFNIEVVITKPKPTHHRGNFPVLDLVKQLNLPVKTVTNKNELDELISSKPFDSKLGVIIDFGIIVSRKVIDYFPLGIVNSHFSLLPEWRGADPITFSILSGQPKTGVSLMLIDEGLDTGKLLTYKTLPIEPMDTTQSLTDRLIKLSDKLLQDYLPKYIIGSIKPKNQPHPDRATYSRKLTKEDGIIDWNKSAQQIEREIRAYIEWPKSRTKIADKEIIITKAHALPTNIPNNPIGKFEAVGNALMVECGKGTLCIDRLKPAGKSEMTAMAFLAGYKNLINQ
jgi:methionyl-tRNA formyltransferase